MATDINARYGEERQVARSALARKAVSLAAPMIREALGQRQFAGSGFVYLVILDPARTSASSLFEEAILHEEALGEPGGRPEAEHAAFAREKARLSWINRCDGHVAQHVLPQLLQSGATPLSGSVWLDGIVVAASGSSPVYDEVFAGTVAVCLRALVREAKSAEQDNGRQHRRSAPGQLSTGWPEMPENR